MLNFRLMSVRLLKISKWILIVSTILVLLVIADNYINNKPISLIFKLLIPFALIGYYCLKRYSK